MKVSLPGTVGVHDSELYRSGFGDGIDDGTPCTSCSENNCALPLHVKAVAPESLEKTQPIDHVADELSLFRPPDDVYDATVTRSGRKLIRLPEALLFVGDRDDAAGTVLPPPEKGEEMHNLRRIDIDRDHHRIHSLPLEIAIESDR